MFFNVICENKILAKISEFTVIALGKCEVHFKKSHYSFSTINGHSKSRAVTQVFMSQH